jgi:hypothetical protein
MAERVEIGNLTEEQARNLEDAYALQGATQFEISAQDDGFYTLSFLPGEPDFPTDTHKEAEPAEEAEEAIEAEEADHGGRENEHDPYTEEVDGNPDFDTN